MKGKKPSIRFPEFKDDWQQKRLGDIAEVNPKNEVLHEKFIYIDLESVTDGELLKETEVLKSNAPSRAQRVLRKDDVLFQMVRPYQKNNYYFSKNGNYVASTGYAQLRTKESPMYVYQYLHNQKFVNDVILRCTGTSYPAINSSDLSNIEISIPTLPEQKRIASFFTVVDKKIAELKQKKALLEQYKKGVMQKIFSQELRFKDDNGKKFPKWEKKKLGEICKMQAGKFINATDIYNESNSELFPCYGGNGLRGYSRVHNQNGKYPLIGRQGAHCGNVNLAEGKFYATEHAVVVYSKNGFNTEWMFYLLTTLNLNQYSTGLAQPGLSVQNIEKVETLVPISIEEQTKIANFLSAIDEKINQTETQIQQMQEWKTGLLQKMFV